MTISFLHELDKKNFFYETIVTLAYTQFGVNELYARGFMMYNLKEFPGRSAFINEIRKFNFPADVNDQIFRTRTFTPLIFVPGFQTKDERVVYQMEPKRSAIHFVLETGGRTKVNLELTHMTIVAAWEKAMAFTLLDSPVLQFFRHLRNAAAHNGKFHFTKNVLHQQTGELLKIAKWGNFEIKAILQGQPLMLTDKNDRKGFWDQGDLVEFLLDFENHYPSVNIF